MHDIAILKVPFCSGSDRNGSQLAPDWLLDNGIKSDGCLVSNVKILTQDPNGGVIQDGVRSLDSVEHTSVKIRDEIVDLFAQDKQLVIIGGDHSIALGSISGVLEKDPNVGIIWFDAHGDINTEATSPSANAHGMPVAALMGLCSSKLNDISSVRLKPQNIFWVGARDLDPGEVETINRLGITDNMYSTEHIHSMGMAETMLEIKQKMEAQGVDAVHLSFDIDGMDPSIVFATGTRVENGLMPEDLNVFIEGLRGLPKMKSMDFVEYNPLLDDEEKSTGKWCSKILNRLMKI